MPNPKDKKKILDEYANEIIEEGNRNIRHTKLINKFKKFYFLKRYLIALGIFLIIFFIYSIIVSPPVYSDIETERKEERFKILTERTGEFEPFFTEAIQLLEKHPYFYKKVVNNIQSIEIEKGKYPYMEINQYGNLKINPNSYNVYNDNFKFTASLVHEADHVEYHKSSNLRQWGLRLKCNALLNPGISIDSGLTSLEHRFTSIEICAQKEQIKFHKATNSESGYETRYGMIYSLTTTMKNIMISIFSSSINVHIITD